MDAELVITYESGREVEKIDARENLIRLMDRYKNLIFSICLKMTGDYFTAEDIAQETFISAYTHYDSFDGQNEKAWLCRIASNKCLDYLRSAQAKTDPVEDEFIESSEGQTVVGFTAAKNDPAAIYEAQDVMSTLKNCMAELPDGYSEIAYDHFIRGKTAREISEEKGINLKTIQTKIYRAREMLKKSYRKEWLNV